MNARVYKFPTLPFGTVLQKRYQLRKKLGGGGFGAVYLAQDIRLNRLVAVKELLHPSSTAQALFRQEAAVLAQLDHPSLVKVSDFFAEGRSYYLVMDYIAGRDLLDLAVEASESRNRLPLAQIARWMLQTCDAVAYLHTLTPPIIHRDIKPANIRLDQYERAILVDFGIAKIDPKAKTQSMAQAISQGFSPPEQYEGGGHTDTRSDVYALGATAYCLLTLTPPPDSFARASNNRGLKPLTQFDPHIPKALEAVVFKALSLSRSQRYQNAGELLQALRAATEGIPTRGSHPLDARAQAAKPAPSIGTPKTTICPSCGVAYRASARFCPNCGYSLQPGVTCPQCGAVNRPGARFCTQCGAMLAQVGSSVNKTGPTHSY